MIWKKRKLHGNMGLKLAYIELKLTYMGLKLSYM